MNSTRRTPTAPQTSANTQHPPVQSPDLSIYVRLSDQLALLHNPQRSDRFLRLLLQEIREGRVEAVVLRERFPLPKMYKPRGKDTTVQREKKDMLILRTPAFLKWFDEQNLALAPARSGGRIKVTVQAIESGLLDFKALANETRAKMKKSYTKGQTLGKATSNARQRRGQVSGLRARREARRA